MTRADLAGKKPHEVMCGKASYNSATFKVPELFSTTHSNAVVCLWSLLYGYVLHLMHLLAVDVTEAPALAIILIQVNLGLICPQDLLSRTFQALLGTF